MIEITWKDIEERAKELYLKINESVDKFDYVVGIGGSGLVHALLISKYLKIPLVPIMAPSYKGRKKEAVSVYAKPDIDLKEKNILVVDDIIATGETLKEIKKVLLKEYGVGSVVTAVGFLSLLVCREYPDFYARTYTRKKDEWILFPWDDPSDFEL